MEVEYRLKHLAEELNITESAARKYYGLFEENGHKFDRNKQSYIVFNRQDVELFKKMIELRDEQGLKLQDAVQRSIIIINGSDYNNHRSDLSINDPVNYMQSLNDKMDDIKNLLKEQNEVIHEQRQFMTKQQETIEHLKNYVDEQKEQKLLKEKLEEEIQQKEEEKEEQNSTSLEEKTGEKKKGFWSRLFGY
ncbi:hypothetical protein [uncultured Marinococcus sp.]|uniref:hypothetical protein n=1 Tax=uncultured Marinococcus sp. TaxID=487012 RepID=UPI002609D7E5|nr:hypothetical protein [uncultured Marinococcus sp.]